MAEDKIVQTVELQGADKVQQDFKRTGDAGEQAFEQMGKAAEKTNFDKLSEEVASIVQALRNLQSNASNVSDELSSVAQANAQVAQSSQAAGQQVGFFSTSLGRLVAVAATVGGAIVLLRNQIESTKTAMRDIGALADAAGSAGVDLDKFQGLETIFRGLGVSAENARTLIKGFADDADTTADKVVKLSGAGKQLIDTLNKQGVRFSDSEGGMNAFRSSLAGVAREMAGGRIDAEKLIAVMERFKDSTDPEDMIKFANALGNLAQGGKALGDVLGETVGGMGKVIRIAQQVEKPVSEVIQAFEQFKKSASPQSFEKLANALAKITDEEERLSKATELLGDDLGPKLARAIEVQKDVVTGLIEKYKDLGIGIDDTAVKIADKFNRALANMNIAMEQGRREMALLIAPALTPFIEKFTQLIRTNRGALAQWASTIRDEGIKALEDLFKILSGQDEDLATKWVKPLIEAMQSLGQAAQNVFNTIIMPAIKGVSSAFQGLANLINNSFGTNLSPATLGIVVALGLMLGGVKSIILALGVLFGLTQPGFEAIGASLGAIGIDVSKLKAAFDEVSIAVQAAFEVIFGPPPEGGRSFLSGVIEVLKTIPVLVPVAIAAFLLLRRAAVAIVPVISRVFGVDVTPMQAGILLIAGTISGIFSSALVAGAAAVTILAGSLRTVLAIFELIAKLNPFVALIAGIVLLVAQFDRAAAAAQFLIEAFDSLFGTRIQDFVSGADAIVAVIASLSIALTVLAARAISASIALTPLLATIAAAGAVLAVFNSALKADTEQATALDVELKKLNDEFLNMTAAQKANSEVQDDWNRRWNATIEKFSALGQAQEKSKAETKTATQSMADDYKTAAEQIRKSMEEARAETAKGVGTPGGATQDGNKLPIVETFKQAGRAIAEEGQKAAQEFGKVIQVPKSAQSAIESIMKGITDDLKQFAPALDQQRLNDSFDQLKQKVSEVEDSLGVIPEKAQVVSGELGQLAQDVSSQFAGIKDTTDSISTSIIAIPTGVDGVRTATDIATEAANNLALAWDKVTESVARAAEKIAQTPQAPGAPAATPEQQAPAVGPVPVDVSGIQNALSQIQQTAASTFENVKASATTAFADIGNSAAGMATEFSSQSAKVVDTARTVSDQASQAFQGIKIGNVADSTAREIAKVQTQVDRITSGFDQAATSARQLVAPLSSVPNVLKLSADGTSAVLMGMRAATTEAQKLGSFRILAFEDLPAQIQKAVPAMTQLGRNIVAIQDTTQTAAQAAQELAASQARAAERVDDFKKSISTAVVENGKLVQGGKNLEQGLEGPVKGFEQIKKSIGEVIVENGKIKSGAAQLELGTQSAIKGFEQIKQSIGDVVVQGGKVSESMQKVPETVQAAVAPAKELSTSITGVEGAVKKAIDLLTQLKTNTGEGKPLIDTKPTEEGLIALNSAITKASESAAQLSAGVTEGKPIIDTKQAEDGLIALHAAITRASDSLTQLGSAGDTTVLSENLTTSVTKVDELGAKAVGLGDSFRAGFEGTAEAVRSVWDILKNGVEQDINTIKQKIQELQQLRQQIPTEPTAAPTVPGAPVVPGAAPAAGASAGIITALPLITQVLTKIQEVRTALNEIGTAISTGLSAAIQPVASGIDTIAQSVNSLRSSFDAILPSVQPITDALSQLPQIVDSFSQSLNNAANVIAQMDFSSIASTVQEAFDTGPVQAFAQAMQEVDSAVQSVIASLQQAISAAQQLAATQGGGGGGFAAGGPIRGASGVDKVPAWLTSGEWVIRKGAVQSLVRRFGQGIMPLLNTGRLPSTFNLGGLVSGLQSSLAPQPMRMPALHLADGGEVPSKDLGFIRLGGFPDGVERRAHVDEETADAIIRVAKRNRVHSAGGPSWFRGG